MKIDMNNTPKVVCLGDLKSGGGFSIPSEPERLLYVLKCL